MIVMLFSRPPPRTCRGSPPRTASRSSWSARASCASSCISASWTRPIFPRRSPSRGSSAGRSTSCPRRSSCRAARCGLTRDQACRRGRTRCSSFLRKTPTMRRAISSCPPTAWSRSALKSPCSKRFGRGLDGSFGIWKPLPIGHEATGQGHLPLCVAAALGLGLRHRVFKAEGYGKIPRQFAHAVRPHGRKARIEPKIEELAHFFDRALFNHAIEACVDRGVKRFALRGNDERQNLARRKQRGRASSLPLGQRNTCRVD